MTKKYCMLIKSDATENNNKFYEIKLEDDDSVVIRYGRVGSKGAIQNKGHGLNVFEDIKSKKMAPKKGYKEVDVVVSEGGLPTSSSMSLVEIAKRDIASDNTELHDLLTRLAEINRFQLLSASGGQIDIIDGEVKTALGVLISLNSINAAKTKLDELSKLVEVSDLGVEYVTTLEEYLTLIPQKIQTKRGWDKNFFTEFTSFEDQINFLEQLDDSVKNSKPVDVAPIDDSPMERIFGYSLDVVEDGKVFDKINRFYNSGINKIHVASNRKLYKIYKMTNDDKMHLYRKIADRIGNEQMLWHGTRASNVLSILKGGLIIPPTTGGNYSVSGRMFGNFVYFSDQSTKSLNYSAGYWGSGGYEKGNIFMLNTTVAMGKPYTPTGPTGIIPKGYDSIYAIGGKSGVMNNEMVIPDLNQFRLDYLCEFE